MKLQYKHTIYACYVGYVVQAIINNLSPLLFLTFRKSFGITLPQIGLLISGNFGVQILVDFVCARYVDKIGYRKSMIIAHGMSAIGIAGIAVFPFAFSNPFAGLCVAVVCNGIGGGILEVLVSPIVSASPDTGAKASAMSLLHSFYCWGHVAVVILSTVGFRIFGMERWYILPILWSIVPLANIALFAAVPISVPGGEGEGLKVRELFSMRLFWVFLVLMICSGASEQAMSQWASMFAEAGLKVSKTTGDLLGPCAFAALMGLSRVFYGKFGERMDLRKFILASSVLCVASYLVAVFSPYPILALAGCALCGLSVGIMWPGTFSLSVRHCPQGSTAMFAFLALAGDVGCAAGPGVVSLASRIDGNGSGLKAGLLFAIVFPAILFLTTLTGIRKK